jgi:hypothetical protein
MEMIYNKGTTFDGKEYLKLKNEKYLPFIPEMIDDKTVYLKSDSRHRKDIPLLAELKYE